MSVGSGSVPIGMRRPSAAREALRFSPLLEAGRADASGIERVPLIPALAEPLVFFPGQPTAERATDARRTGILLLFKLAIWNDDRIVHHRTHARYYDLRSDPQSVGAVLNSGNDSRTCAPIFFASARHLQADSVVSCRRADPLRANAYELRAGLLG